MDTMSGPQVIPTKSQCSFGGIAVGIPPYLSMRDYCDNCMYLSTYMKSNRP